LDTLIKQVLMDSWELALRLTGSGFPEKHQIGILETTIDPN
jgi:hypothetical protein